MYDKSLMRELLEQILDATNTVLVRFEAVDSSDFFLDSPEGMEKSDSICMKLIAIGESLKNIDKITKNELLKKYPQVDWKGALEVFKQYGMSLSEGINIFCKQVSGRSDTDYEYRVKTDKWYVTNWSL